jgi:hypothetical protein
MLVAIRIGLRRARDPTFVQIPCDASDAVPGQPLLEDPPHVRRRGRIGVKPVQPPSPLGVNPIRVWARVYDYSGSRRESA